MSGSYYTGPFSLDAELFREVPETYALAQVVSEAIEARRAIESRRPEAGHAKRGNLGRGRLAAHKPWHEFIDFDLLQGCAARHGLPLAQTVERVRTELNPDNWETLFWMHVCIKMAGEAVRDLAVLAGMVKDAGAQAVRAGAKKAANARNEENQIMKAEAIEEFKRLRASAQAAGEKLTKREAARQLTKFVPVEYDTALKWLRNV